MKVLNIGTAEMDIIEESLDFLGGTYNKMIQEEEDRKLKEEFKYKESHIRTTRKLIKNMKLQELCERCLSYFWDRFEDMGCFSDEIEWLMEDMGVDEDEMKEMFREAGFGEE